MLGFNPLSSAPLGVTPSNISFSVNAGSFAVTGQDVTFNKAVTLNAESGTFALSVHGAAKMIAEFVPEGQFTLTGNDVSFGVNVSIPADTGSFSVSGQDVTLSRQTIFSDLVDGEFVLTGQPISFGFGMGAANGSFVLTGQDITESISERVDHGVFLATFNDANFIVNRRIIVETGQFNIQGQDIKIGGFRTADPVPEETYTEQILGAETYTEQSLTSEAYTEQTTNQIRSYLIHSESPATQTNSFQFFSHDISQHKNKTGRFYFSHINQGGSIYFRSDLQLDNMTIGDNYYSMQDPSGDGWETSTANADNFTDVTEWVSIPSVNASTSGRWNRRSGSTPTSNTGITTFSNAYYLYTEMSGAGAFYKAWLRSPIIQFTDNVDFTYFLGRRGSRIGVFQIYFDVLEIPFTEQTNNTTTWTDVA